MSNNGGKIVIGGKASRPGSEMSKAIIINGKVDEMMPIFKLEGD